MICCVKNPLKLGCYSTCDNVDFGVMATVAGIHTVIFDAFGYQVKIRKTFALNEALIFPLGSLNEVSNYLVSIVNSNNVAVNPTGGYDGFSLETVLTKVLTI